MNKQNFDKLLKNGELCEKKNCIKKKSDVWKFSMVHFKDSNIYADYVKSKTCSSYLEHHKANSGTSHLRLHLKTCRSTNNDLPAAHFLLSSRVSLNIFLVN